MFLFCIDPYIDSVLFFLPLVQVISTNKYLSFLTVDPHNDDKLEQTDKKQWKTHECIHQIQNVGPALFKKKQPWKHYWVAKFLIAYDIIWK